MNEWDFEFDVVIVGSGAAGAGAALTAHTYGLRPLILEKSDILGGSTALSGGGMWAPCNRFMREAGAPDSEEEAQIYLDEIVSETGPATSAARRRAFISNVAPAMDLLERAGLKLRPISDYPDYYPERRGARSGRGVEPQPFNVKKLGDWAALLPPRNFPRTWPLSTAQSADVYLGARTLKGFRAFGAIGLKHILARLKGQDVVGLGSSLAAQLLYLVKSKDIPLWRSTGAERLIVEGDRVVGVVARREGREMRIRALHAVHIGAGGFARNSDLRRRVQPVGGEWSAASPGDQGDGLSLAHAVGADLANMDQAWWGPVALLPDGRVFFLVSERFKPGSIIVDQTGERYLNEAQPYEDAARIMLERPARNESGPHSWLVFDQTYRNNYPFGALLPRRTPKNLISSGYFKKADSLKQLAAQIGVAPATLSATLDRFNVMARLGVDEDYGRGTSAYDRHYGDPRVKPNPNLAPLAKPPFYAVGLYPGDIGTKGGLVTDENARVLTADGSPIQGLYASGNSTASVMGGSYPGPGVTLGPALTFSFIAMRHLSEQARRNSPPHLSN